MKVAVASGKGGTGKTLVATNLAWFLAEAGHAVAYVDADVEGPNGHLFLPPARTHESRSAVPIPTLLGGTCSGCGECQRACAFHAIIALKDRVMVLPELCHSCGTCLIACPTASLTEAKRQIGTLRRGESERVSFFSAELDVREPRATPLIQRLLEEVERASGSGQGLVVVDAAPGTSCPTIEAVRGADRVLLVTEPTPFGLHDLELAVEMCQVLGLAAAAIVNRSDLGDRRVAEYLAGAGVPVLAEIPFSREIARCCAEGELAVRSVPSFRAAIDRIAWQLIERVAA